MIGPLFPPQVITITAPPFAGKEPLFPEEERLVQNAVLKRQQEFSTGRQCVREALLKLNIENFPLLAGEHREPLWPPGITGSITHCTGFCGVAVARQGLIISLGLDAEPAEPLTTDELNLVCTPGEIQQWTTVTGPLKPILPKLIFSAKESAYKCYFPVTRIYMDFQDVEVHIHSESNSFTVSLGVNRPAGFSEVRTLKGHYALGNSFIYTGVTWTSDDSPA